MPSLSIVSRCDLLEISYLCGRINNEKELDYLQTLVVICSKFPTFVVESTTDRGQPIQKLSL